MQRKLVSGSLSLCAILITASLAHAQVDSINIDLSTLFRKGTWELNTRPYLQYYNLDEKENGQDQGSNSRFNLNLETHYYFRNKWAVGLEINYDRTSSKNGLEQVSTDFSTYGHLTYGIPIKDNWGLYLRGGVGIGSGKVEITQGTSSQEIKYDLFGYKFEVGSPIYLNRELYLNPNLTYGSTSRDYDDGEIVKNRFQVGIGLVSYLNCGDHSDSFSLSRPNRYAPGVSYLGVHGMTSFSSGSEETTFNSGQKLEEDFNRFNLKLDYTYQIFQNFAVGADIGYRSMTEKSNDQGFEDLKTRFVFAPKLVYNLPSKGWLNDAFISFGAGFGSAKNEVTAFGNTNETKDNLFVIGGNLGYNWFVTRSTLFTFTVGYESTTQKNKENSDQKIEESGIYAGFGLRTGINIGGGF